VLIKGKTWFLISKMMTKGDSLINEILFMPKNPQELHGQIKSKKRISFPMRFLN